MIEIDGIVFSDPIWSGRQSVVAQDILYEGKVIGSLETRAGSLYAKIEEVFSFAARQQELPEGQELCLAESEDEDWFFVQCSNIVDFIRDYNIVKGLDENVTQR